MEVILNPFFLYESNFLVKRDCRFVCLCHRQMDRSNMSLFHCRKQCLGKFCTALFALIVWNNPNPDQFSGIRIIEMNAAKNIADALIFRIICNNEEGGEQFLNGAEKYRSPHT